MLQFEVHEGPVETFGEHMVHPWDSHGEFWEVSLVSWVKTGDPRSENSSILVPFWNLLGRRKSCESVVNNGWIAFWTYPDHMNGVVRRRTSWYGGVQGSK